MMGRLGPDMAFSAVNGLLSTELDQRTAAFEAAHTALDTQIKYWSQPGCFVVLDTSVYITHPDKLEDTDFAALLDVRGEPVHILVPIVVVDELDGLKKRGQRNVPWRASYTLAVLDRVLAGTTGAARLREEDFSALRTGGLPRGEVTIEVLLDPPGHVRLPINDDEIIDRALTAQPLTGRALTLVTYDTGQSIRARSAGLRVRKLTIEIGDEPK
jgi:predicted ribonuclease YlaK